MSETAMPWLALGVIAGLALVGALEVFVRLRDAFARPRIEGDPPVYNFQCDSAQGQVTIHCSVWPGGALDDDQPRPDEQLGASGAGVASHRVGALVVELEQNFLRLRWEAGEVGDLRPTSFALGPRSDKPADQQSDGRQHQRSDDPAQGLEVDVHAGNSSTRGGA